MSLELRSNADTAVENYDFVQDTICDNAFNYSVKQMFVLGLSHPKDIALIIRVLGMTKSGTPLSTFKKDDLALCNLRTKIGGIIIHKPRKNVLRMVDKKSRQKLSPEKAAAMKARVYRRCGKSKEEANKLAAIGLAGSLAAKGLDESKLLEQHM